MKSDSEAWDGKREYTLDLLGVALQGVVELVTLSGVGVELKGVVTLELRLLSGVGVGLPVVV